MLDALQAKEIAKTNFSALENDLELNNEYFNMQDDDFFWEALSSYSQSMYFTL